MHAIIISENNTVFAKSDFWSKTRQPAPVSPIPLNDISNGVGMSSALYPWAVPSKTQKGCSRPLPTASKGTIQVLLHLMSN